MYNLFLWIPSQRAPYMRTGVYTRGTRWDHKGVRGHSERSHILIIKVDNLCTLCVRLYSFIHNIWMFNLVFGTLCANFIHSTLDIYHLQILRRASIYTIFYTSSFNCKICVPPPHNQLWIDAPGMAGHLGLGVIGK